VAPFGYAGQQRDAGPGTYAMRARRYDPASGRFQSQDPLAYSPQVPVTINPYEYAGDMPTGVTDPSGQGWVWPGQTCCFADYQQQSLIGGQAEGITPVGSVAADGYAGLLQRALGGGTDTRAFWVPVLKHSAVATCHQGGAWTQTWLLANTYNANVVDLRRHQYWDIEHADINSRATAGHLREIVQLARTNGMLWPAERCNHFAEELRCAGSTRVDPGLELGTSFPPAANLPSGAEVIPLGNGVQGILLTVPYRVDRALLAWQQAPGLILYIVVPLRTTPLCTGLVNCLFGAARVLVLDDFKTLFYSDAPWYDRGLAAVGVVGDVFFVAKLAKFGGLGARFARAAGTARLGAGLGTDLRTTLRAAYDAWRGTCGRCFPAGTGVATAKGTTAIERLKVGDTVLSEDPKTGTVEPEAVQAVIDDGVKPLIALDLSDGSTLKVTGDHPFWVDGGGNLDHPGWLEAGQLRPGDRLRTADGRGVTVLAVHWNAGEAHVYTLTVATDHTFFVGPAHVLVHNSDGPCGPLFRGTSEGFAGNASVQATGVTPASTDPLVATLFATEAENFGRGVVHIALPADLAGVTIGPGNVLSGLESEVGVHITPAEFEARASVTLSVAQARSILKELGVQMPTIIRDVSALDYELKTTPRLTSKQIQEFLLKASKLGE